MMKKLETEEIARYSRHIVLKGVGADGQQKLKNAKVLMVGAGGLGSPVIAYLAAAGVGNFTIVDDDNVELSNLQRQIVHSSKNIDQNKAQSGSEFAHALNPHVTIKTVSSRFELGNGAELVASNDIVVDGTDLFSTRRLVADICEVNNTSLVSGAVSMFDGQLSVFAPHLTDQQGNAYPRFSCLYPHSPNDSELPRCETEGVLGATTGVIGTLMAMEVIKLIVGVGEPLLGRLLLYDGRNAKFSELKYRRR